MTMREPIPPAGKTCGGCSKCCELVPVHEIGLRSFTRCAHLADPWNATGPGCSFTGAGPFRAGTGRAYGC
jgi:hypothetical protein